MLMAEAASSGLSFAGRDDADPLDVLLWDVVERPINNSRPAVVVADMIGVGFKKFKIFYSVVRWVSVNVVYNFFLFEFSTDMLLHNVSMMKNPLAVYINSHIATLKRTGQALFQNCIVWRDVMIVSVLVKSGPVFRAHLSVGCPKYVITAIDSADFSFCHASS